MKKFTPRPRVPLNYSLAHAILDILYDIGESTSWGSPYTAYKQLRRNSMWPQYKNWRLKRALRYLEEKQRIKIKKIGDGQFIKLTKKGKLDALMLKMLKHSHGRKKWDGKYRLIIWDIPESSRHHRDRLRNFCKRMQFYQLQKSVYVTPFSLPRSAVEYLRESGLDQFIRFLRVDRADDDRTFKKYFNL